VGAGPSTLPPHWEAYTRLLYQSGLPIRAMECFF
jgi:hypothetical protein